MIFFKLIFPHKAMELIGFNVVKFACPVLQVRNAVIYALSLMDVPSLSSMSGGHFGCAVTISGEIHKTLTPNLLDAVAV